MSAVLGFSGWVLAAAGLTAALALRMQLVRHLEAVARACHELRGPLTAIRLGLELGARIANLRPRMQAIELELGRAALALEDLSELRAGRHPGARRRLEAVDVGALGRDSVEGWTAPAAARGVRLRWRSSEATPVVVVGDRLRLAQALGNLIANAIEHGGGEVWVSLAVEADRVRVEVMDDGPGLPETIDKLLRRRRRARGSDRGHGLAIVNAIAVAHGGRLAAEPTACGPRLVLELRAAPA